MKNLILAATIATSSLAHANNNLAGKWRGFCDFDGERIKSSLALEFAGDAAIYIGSDHGILPSMQIPIGEGAKLEKIWTSSTGSSHSETYEARWQENGGIHILHSFQGQPTTDFWINRKSDRLDVDVAIWGMQRHCEYRAVTPEQ